MLETFDDYISLIIAFIVFIFSLRYLIGAIFYNPNKDYGKSIDIFLDYDSFDE